MEDSPRRTSLLVGAVIAAALTVVLAMTLVTVMLVDGPEESRETRPAATQSATDPIRVALESHPKVIEEMIGRRQARGVFLCGYELLGRDGNTLYLYVGCGDFSTGPEAHLLSGSAEPARATIAGEALTAVTFPRQESLEKDIRRLFPSDLAETAIGGADRIDLGPSMEELELEATG